MAELKLSGLSLNLESFTPFILSRENKIMIRIFEGTVSSKPQQAWGWLYYKSERENVVFLAGFYFLPHWGAFVISATQEMESACPTDRKWPTVIPVVDFHSTSFLEGFIAEADGLSKTTRESRLQITWLDKNIQALTSKCGLFLSWFKNKSRVAAVYR